MGTARRRDYIHDCGGNRILVERRAAFTDTSPTSQDSYTRTTGSNRIASITTSAGTPSFIHDVCGNLSGRDRPGTNNVGVGSDGFARRPAMSPLAKRISPWPIVAWTSGSR